MNPMQRTLLVIAVFVALIVGSFVWFIVTWDAANESPVTEHPVSRSEVRGA
jgi:hypothetical protein